MRKRWAERAFRADAARFIRWYNLHIRNLPAVSRYSALALLLVNLVEITRCLAFHQLYSQSLQCRWKVSSTRYRDASRLHMDSYLGRNTSEQYGSACTWHRGPCP
jgi:hypothetical protein